MQNSDESEFVGLIEALCAAFGKEPSEALLQGYWIGLEDIPLGSLRLAVARSLQSSEHMPRPADLRRLSGEVTSEDRAVVAWGVVRRSLVTVGSWRSVDFDDPLVNATIRTLGGWEALCGMEADKLDAFVSKDFARVYRALGRSAWVLAPEAGAYLVGRTERLNAGSYKAAPPVRVAVGLPQASGAVRLGSGGAKEIAS